MVVIGAGFAGLSAAKHLRDQPVEVTIVDHHNFHTFQPLLYQVATAGLDPADVAYPVRTIFGRDPNVVFRHGQAVSVDVEARRVALADGTALDYDRLVVATGATTGFFAVPGASQHSLPLYTLADARHLRNDILGCLEAADAHPGDFDGGAPTFVVVGGGATGVEMSGALLELLEVAVRRDRLRIDPQRSKVVLLEAGRPATPRVRREGQRLRAGDAALPGRRRPTPDAGGRSHRRGGPPRRRRVAHGQQRSSGPGV